MQGKERDGKLATIGEFRRMLCERCRSFGEYKQAIGHKLAQKIEVDNYAVTSTTRSAATYIAFSNIAFSNGATAAESHINSKTSPAPPRSPIVHGENLMLAGTTNGLSEKAIESTRPETTTGQADWIDLPRFLKIF